MRVNMLIISGPTRFCTVMRRLRSRGERGRASDARRVNTSRTEARSRPTCACACAGSESASPGASEGTEGTESASGVCASIALCRVSSALYRARPLMASTSALVAAAASSADTKRAACLSTRTTSCSSSNTPTTSWRSPSPPLSSRKALVCTSASSNCPRETGFEAMVRCRLCTSDCSCLCFLSASVHCVLAVFFDLVRVARPHCARSAGSLNSMSVVSYSSLDIPRASEAATRASSFLCSSAALVSYCARRLPYSSTVR
mmetsp:Transcript_27866/g.61708  ORF Transcript_27866/g.61708 Transcript_27866/m.61708 type:complete len:260 (-) Transcript_27866:342-1121(-)